MRITSARNPVVKYVRSLERAHIRRDEGHYLIEGVRLVHEALSTGQCATVVLYDPASLTKSTAGSLLLAEIPRWAKTSYEVDQRTLLAAALTETPSGIVAVVRTPESPPLVSHGEDRFGVVLDRVADPGNLGTILRTAAAAGVRYVVTLRGSADPFAPKVVRAGMGAHFRLDLYAGLTWEDCCTALSRASSVGLEARGATSVYDFQWPERTTLIVGSEAHGLSSEVRPHLAHLVRIPMVPGVESLNAAVAASLAIYAALGPTITLQS